MMKTRLLGFLGMLLLAVSAFAHPGGLDASGCHHNRKTGEYHCHRSQDATRSSSVRRQFLKNQGLTSTPKGCQVDHIRPLSCGGADSLENLQLLCGEALKAKERTERQCR